MENELLMLVTTRITKERRRALNGHLSFAVWLTGLSGSGKSTLANALEIELHKRNLQTFLLDGDVLRTGLTKDLGFSEADRRENTRRVAEVANLLVNAGIVVIVATISPFRIDRALARELFEPKEFVEIYMDCPLAVCEMRDPKGLYRKARVGILPQFTGISSPYEPPTAAELTIDSGLQSVDESVHVTMAHLIANGLIDDVRGPTC